MLELRKQGCRQGPLGDREVGLDRADDFRRQRLVRPEPLPCKDRGRAERYVLVCFDEPLEPFGCESLEGAEELPLVGPRLERRRIDEDADAGAAAPALKRQRDQIPESLLG